MGIRDIQQPSLFHLDIKTTFHHSMFEFLTKSKQDVICSLLRLVEQRPDQLSLRGDVERQRMPQLHPRQPRDH